jgi:group I intron endonuclease
MTRNRKGVCGIYKIENIAKGKSYVGSSVNVGSRWKAHLKQLETESHHSQKLQRAWNKYGKSSFEFSIIEECAPEKSIMLEREQYRMDTLDAVNAGYNVCRFAGNCLGTKRTAEQRVKMSNAQYGNQKWLGKKHSQESKDKLSESRKKISDVISQVLRDRWAAISKEDRKKTPEQIERMTKARKPLSKESHANMVDGLKNRAINRIAAEILEYEQNTDVPDRVCKSCKICGTEQYIIRFSKNKQMGDGYENFCKSCRNGRGKALKLIRAAKRNALTRSLDTERVDTLY